MPHEENRNERTDPLPVFDFLENSNTWTASDDEWGAISVEESKIDNEPPESNFPYIAT